MCQYSAENGSATDWHLIHLGHLSLSKAGLLMTEATAVSAQGRISKHCLGMYSDENEFALTRVLRSIRQFSDIRVGVQLNHAGRKGSVHRPWDHSGAPLTVSEGAWETVGPSAIPFAEGWPEPREMTISDMHSVIDAHVQAAERCRKADIDVLELHAAHGYLLSSYLSPIANRRRDMYGGTMSNRMRFPLEVFEALRAVWPSHKPLGVRLNGTDWDDRGISISDATAFARELKVLGCDFVDISGGGNNQIAIATSPGYQVPLAAAVRAAVEMPTIAVGLIREPHFADELIRRGDIDMIAIARGILNDPRWPWHAAEDLGVKLEVNAQYKRAATRAGSPPLLAPASG